MLDFGTKIDLLQAERGWTNVRLAQELGVKPQNITKLKRAKASRKTTIWRLSKVFKIPVSYFFDAEQGY